MDIKEKLEILAKSSVCVGNKREALRNFTYEMAREFAFVACNTEERMIVLQKYQEFIDFDIDFRSI